VTLLTRSFSLRAAANCLWTLVGPEAGPVVEPGHQFEWAWLLLRWSQNAAGDAFSSARRLVEIEEAIS
jgi:mannose/cellobiose epimerase-like protein (N-acyl-D-glucosamine 2-epimerase family)